MAILLNNVTTTDKASDNEISTPNAVGLSVLIANRAVIANFKQVPKGGAGNSNEMPWGPDLLLAPQTAQYRNVSGFRCRSALSGSPAQVVAVLSEPSDPQALGATPYTASLSSNGTVTPGATAVQVSKDGALIGTEPILDVLTGKLATGGFLWDISDDVANTQLKARVIGPPVIDIVAGDVLPVVALDGYTISVVPDKTNFAGVRWLAQWNNATGFWDVIGGSPMRVNGSPGATFASLTAIGATGWEYHVASSSLLIPLAGDYDMGGSAWIGNNGVTALVTISVANIATSSVPVGNDRRQDFVQNGVADAALATEDRIAGRTAGQRHALAVSSANNTVTLQSVDFWVMPYRLHS